MGFGVHYGALGLTTPFQEGFRILQELGADCVELVMKEKSPLFPDISEATLLTVRAMAEERSLIISGVTNACLWQTPLTSNDPDARREGLESIKQQIRIAHTLGAKELLIIPGYAGTSYTATAEKVRYDIAIERSYEALKQMLPQAEDAGVCLCVENVWNRMLLSPLELVSFVDRLDSPSARLYFDIGNAMLYGDPEMWIPLLGKRIKAVHVKDALRHLADTSSFVNLGKGDVPFPLVSQALKELGFDGNLTLEVHHPLSRESLGNEIQKMKELMS